MIYAVSPIIQKTEVSKYCFGECGCIAIGGIDLGEYGPFFPCYQIDCKFEEAKTPVIGEAFGDEVCARKLKPYNHDSPADTR